VNDIKYEIILYWSKEDQASSRRFRNCPAARQTGRRIRRRRNVEVVLEWMNGSGLGRPFRCRAGGVIRFEDTALK